MEFIFNKYGDFKAEFKAYVDLLFSKADTLTCKQRIKLTDKLTEAYVTTTGFAPDGVQLDRLATLILRDELIKNDPHKVSKTEYPILSESQEERRNKKNAGNKPLDIYGTDRRKHGRGTRNRKTNYID